ncbi:MAG: ATP-dependent Lon protease, partial [Acidimicrobiaceae bacterium]|nr:ATP-dependent Lon protease [Acidimicrobiaceae bacterium]
MTDPTDPSPTDPSPTDPPAVPLPMFPLGMVLFPYMPLAVHVFEPRYRALVRDCLRDRREFGVVLIERGSEVGGGDQRFSVGTVAHITETSEYRDGRWDVLGKGTRRVRVATWLPDDPYPLALTVERPDQGDDDIDPDALAEADQAVRRALALLSELGEVGRAPATYGLNPEPRLAVWQLAVIAPVSAIDQQRILEVDDANQRLRMLTQLAAD